MQRPGTEAIRTQIMENDYKQPMRIGRINALNGCAVRRFWPPRGTTTRTLILKGNCMQRPGTEVSRTQIMENDCKQRLRIRKIRALNGCAGKDFGAATRNNYKNNSDTKSKRYAKTRNRSNKNPNHGK